MYACHRYHVVKDEELSAEQRALFPLPVMCPRKCNRLSFPITPNDTLLRDSRGMESEEKRTLEKAIIASISDPKWRKT